MLLFFHLKRLKDALKCGKLKFNIAFDLLKKVYFLVNREIPAILPGYPNHLICYIAWGKIHFAMQQYYFYNPNIILFFYKVSLLGR